MRYPEVQNYIDGRFKAGGNGSLEVYCPLDGEVISYVPLSTPHDLDQAVTVARRAFPGWSGQTIKERVQVFYCYKTLLEQNKEQLACLVQEENGKTMDEAIAEVEKSAEVAEFACSLPQLIGGWVLEVSPGVECREERYPLGVVASITPFNFPIMVPNWTIPIMLALGNTMVLKPSEQVPLGAGRIAELLAQSGLPPGVFNVVNGDRTVVEAICDHPDIQALSFVGSTRVARAVYKRATSNLKRALCMGGAKNHLVVLPDADEVLTAENVVASFTGCAGQRCMAAAVLVAVGDVDHIIKRICEEAGSIVTGEDLGAIISQQAKERIVDCITEAIEEGAEPLLDGRKEIVTGRENGYYLSPTIIDEVRPEMKIAREEVFGPVLVIVRVKDIDEALALENRSPYGNAAAIYTGSGGMARYFSQRAGAGMIGVNIGVPVPREPFSFGGWNQSRFGIGDITGRSSIEFWTRLKKTTTKWSREAGVNWMS
ncbi:MAG: CoA-acylating methylmalonate-semialdehyde dehydrogenase [Fidelibacterota bacterium]|nr:MAG: CoA-acylating methylmalonate-semialdehyde dehydrogenase [Candidatus Neomarinimicrobiota bacterium]